jgi:hypothetical protein
MTETGEKTELSRENVIFRMFVGPSGGHVVANLRLHVFMTVGEVELHPSTKISFPMLMKIKYLHFL